MDKKKDAPTSLLRAIELFAGVGGFRLGLEAAGWNVVWSNQWEPSTKVQHASDIYVKRFGPDGHSNEDISKVVEQVRSGERKLPKHDLLVGGFPCQDYSVARVLNQAAGLEGRKGVLWWQIHALLELHKPRMVLLENVDRLLKSPAQQRGRDFAIILACLNDLGYTVEWRVVNAAEYGFPQRRRRVFIAAIRGRAAPKVANAKGAETMLFREGLMADALPVRPPVVRGLVDGPDIDLVGDLADITDHFGEGMMRSQFLDAGVAYKRMIWTRKVEPAYGGPFATLGDVLIDDADVPESFYVPDNDLEKWTYLKGSKREPRTDRKTGYTYTYNEGPVTFPDPLDQPSRTILTGEGGVTPSRFKHVVSIADGRLRRLTPVELERLNGFPDNWTEGIPAARRAFLMGNALVVGVVERIAKAMKEKCEVSMVLPKVKGTKVS